MAITPFQPQLHSLPEIPTDSSPLAQPSVPSGQNDLPSPALPSQKLSQNPVNIREGFMARLKRDPKFCTDFLTEYQREAFAGNACAAVLEAADEAALQAGIKASLAKTTQIDPSATEAIPLLNQALSADALEDVADPEAELEKNAAFDSKRNTPGGATKRFAEEFDAATGEPTAAYVQSMTDNATKALEMLARFGLGTGHASGSGNNCLIHSILAQLGITGANNIRIAKELRKTLAQRLALKGEHLTPDQYLDTFGSHPGHLMDIINERFPEANVGMRIYIPLPNGALHFVNPETEGGTTGSKRKNSVAVMWVGNHYVPIMKTRAKKLQPPVPYRRSNMRSKNVNKPLST